MVRNQNADTLSRPYANAEGHDSAVNDSDDDDEIIAVVDANDSLNIEKELREDIFLCYHDGPGGSHFGFDKTYSSIKAKFYWPNMYRDVENHIKSCDPCQMASRAYHKQKAPLVPFSVDTPFSRLHMDILGSLTPSSFPHTPSVEYKYVLLVVDLFTGWLEAFPLVSQNAKTVAFVLYSEIFFRYGSPDCIVSDQGSQFVPACPSSL